MPGWEIRANRTECPEGLDMACGEGRNQDDPAVSGLSNRKGAVAIGIDGVLLGRGRRGGGGRAAGKCLLGFHVEHRVDSWGHEIWTSGMPGESWHAEILGPWSGGLLQGGGSGGSAPGPGSSTRAGQEYWPSPVLTAGSLTYLPVHLDVCLRFLFLLPKEPWLSGGTRALTDRKWVRGLSNC